MRSLSLVLAFLAVGAWPTPSLSAQQGSSFAEYVDVNVVNVDVLISDRQGRSVTGLAKAAFQLREDDKKIKIDHFSEDGAAAALFPSIVVYVDDTHIFEAGRNAALDALSPYILERMSTGETAVMVARFDGFVEVLQGFTTDRVTLVAALEDLKQRETKPSQSMLLEREAARLMRESRGGGGSDTIDAMRTYAHVLSEDTVRSLGALTELAGSLGQRAGRKAFYVVADGLAVRPLGQMFDNMLRRSNVTGGARIASGADASEGTGSNALTQAGGGTGLGGIARMQRNTEDLDTGRSFELLAGVANSSKITLYPIRPPVLDAAAAGLGSEATDRQRGVTDLREGPQRLADATGGIAFVTGSDIGGFLAGSNELGAALYSLAYTPDDHPEGSLHALDLKVKGKGLRVRYRQSYVMKSSSARLTDRAIAAATVGWIDNPHGITAEIDDRSQAEDGNWNVTILLTIPIGEIGLVETNGLHQANCRVALLVVTGNGGLTRPQHMEIPLQITEAQLEEARGQVFGARAKLRLPPGSHQLVVGLWDVIGGRGSYIASPIVVGQG